MTTTPRSIPPDVTVDVLGAVRALHERCREVGVCLSAQLGAEGGPVVNWFAAHGAAPDTRGAALTSHSGGGHRWHRATLAGQDVAIHGLEIL